MSVLRKHTPGFHVVPVPIDGRGTLMLADLTTPFGLSVYRYGFPDPEAQLVARLLGPGDVFVDGGANLGLFTLIAASAVGPTGHVLACEPVPETAALLRKNVGMNQFHWVDVRQVALADSPGSADLYSFGAGSALSSFAPEVRDGGRHISVPVITLDDLAGPLLSRVRLVKLDIEGAEVRALRGAHRLLAASVDVLLELEPEHLARQGTNALEMQELFQAAGYRVYDVRRRSDEVELTPLDRLRRPETGPNVFASTRAPEEFPSGIRVRAAEG